MTATGKKCLYCFIRGMAASGLCLLCLLAAHVGTLLLCGTPGVQLLASQTDLDSDSDSTLDVAQRSMPALIDRHISFHGGTTRPTVSLEFSFRKEKRGYDYDWLAEKVFDAHTDNAGRLIKAVFGKISGSDIPTAWLRTWTFDKATGVMTVKLDGSGESDSQDATDEVWANVRFNDLSVQNEEIDVELDGASIEDCNPFPTEVTQLRAVWMDLRSPAPTTLAMKGSSTSPVMSAGQASADGPTSRPEFSPTAEWPYGGALSSISFTLSSAGRANVSEQPSAPPDNPTETRRQLLGRLGSAWVPVITPWTSGLIRILPALLIWWLLPKLALPGSQPLLQQASRVAVLAMFLQGGQILVTQCVDLYQLAFSLRSFSQPLFHLGEPYSAHNWSVAVWCQDVLLWELITAVLVFLPPEKRPVGRLWPKLSNKHATGIRRLLWHLPFAMITVLSVGAIAFSDQLPGLTSDNWLKCAIGALAIVLVLDLPVAIAEVCGQSAPSLLALASGAIAMAWLGMTCTLQSMPDWLKSSAAILMLLLGSVTLSALRRRLWPSSARRTWVNWFAWMAAAFVLSIPAWPIDANGSMTAVVYFPDFVSLLVRLTIVVLILRTFKLILDDGALDKRMSGHWIGLVVVTAAAGIMPPEPDLLGLPVRYLILAGGLYLLLQYGEPFWEKILGHTGRGAQPANPSASPIRPAHLIEQLLAYTSAKSNFATLRESWAEDLAKGTCTPNDFHDKLLKQHGEIEKLRLVGSVPIRRAVFAAGVGQTSSENAVYATKLSLALSIPWLVMYLASFMEQTSGNLQYPLLSFFIDGARILLTYASMGFVFGLMYGSLPGQNGMQKAMVLFAAWALALLPVLPYGSDGWSDWKPLAVAAAQMFTQLSLLGLFGFDFTIVRRAGYDWRALLEAYGMPQLGVSISSIFAAVGISVAALVSSQTTTILSDVLKVMLPQSIQTPALGPTTQPLASASP